MMVAIYLVIGAILSAGWVVNAFWWKAYYGFSLFIKLFIGGLLGGGVALMILLAYSEVVK